jgi:uncharacterized membrane protein
MPTTPASPAGSQMITGLLWGAFAMLAAIGSLLDQRAVSVICWSLALAVAFVLVRLSRQTRTDTEENLTARHTGAPSNMV